MTDLLLESAPLARAKAADVCGAGYPDEGGCAWYHGVWQYFRLLGVVSAPDRHAGFFRDTLGALFAARADARLLISGTADYGLLALVLAIPGADTASITVADRCETPLFLCRWYAERAGHTIATTATDITALEAIEPFDALCCHSFLSQFRPSERPALMASWRRVLRPGGQVITNTRLDPAWREERSGFSPAQVAAFARRVAEAAKATETPGLETAELKAR